MTNPQLTLRDLRKRGGNTLAEVAGATGLDLGGLSRIERGTQFPSRETAEKLAAFYNISFGSLFDAVSAVPKAGVSE